MATTLVSFCFVLIFSFLFDYVFLTAIAVAQCLIVISEDNPSSWKVLCNYGQEFSSLLVLEENHSQVLLRSLSAGIMANVPALAEPYMNQILISLSKTLDIQHRSVLAKITSNLPLLEQTNSHEIEITDDSTMDGLFKNFVFYLFTLILNLIYRRSS